VVRHQELLIEKLIRESYNARQNQQSAKVVLAS
jgi:hypothetical protein